MTAEDTPHNRDLMRQVQLNGEASFDAHEKESKKVAGVGGANARFWCFQLASGSEKDLGNPNGKLFFTCTQGPPFRTQNFAFRR